MRVSFVLIDNIWSISFKPSEDGVNESLWIASSETSKPYDVSRSLIRQSEKSWRRLLLYKRLSGLDSFLFSLENSNIYHDRILNFLLLYLQCRLFLRANCKRDKLIFLEIACPEVAIFFSLSKKFRLKFKTRWILFTFIFSLVIKLTVIQVPKSIAWIILYFFRSIASQEISDRAGVMTICSQSQMTQIRANEFSKTKFAQYLESDFWLCSFWVKSSVFNSRLSSIRFSKNNVSNFVDHEMPLGFFKRLGFVLKFIRLCKDFLFEKTGVGRKVLGLIFFSYQFSTQKLESYLIYQSLSFTLSKLRPKAIVLEAEGRFFEKAVQEYVASSESVVLNLILPMGMIGYDYRWTSYREYVKSLSCPRKIKFVCSSYLEDAFLSGGMSRQDIIRNPTYDLEKVYENVMSSRSELHQFVKTRKDKLNCVVALDYQLPAWSLSLVLSLLNDIRSEVSRVVICPHPGNPKLGDDFADALKVSIVNLSEGAKNCDLAIVLGRTSLIFELVSLGMPVVSLASFRDGIPLL